MFSRLLLGSAVWVLWLAEVEGSVEGSIRRGMDELVGGPLMVCRTRFVAVWGRISRCNEACDSHGETGVINLQGFVARDQGNSLKLVSIVCGNFSGGNVAEKMVERAEIVRCGAEGALVEETWVSAEVFGVVHSTGKDGQGSTPSAVSGNG